MVDYREILRLRSLGHNITRTAEAIHSSRHTIREVWRLADEKDISWPLQEELSNQQLYRLFYPERLDRVQVYMEPDCEYIHGELAKKGVNLTLLHNEYKVKCASTGRFIVPGPGSPRQPCGSSISPEMPWKLTGLAERFRSQIR